MLTLRFGMQGVQVKQLQTLLNEHGADLKVDGDFGASTQRAVIHFQVSRGTLGDGIVGRATWGLLQAPRDGYLPVPDALAGEVGGLPKVLARFRAKGHLIHEDRLNLFGIRNTSRNPNSFDDLLGAALKTPEGWKTWLWPGTTDPGTFWLDNPTKVAGTALLVEGQYSAWKIGMHQGSYEALVQTGSEVSVYRDRNKDGKLTLDPGSIEKGWFGINIHRATKQGRSKTVDKWSAGCQVHASSEGFAEMMFLARQQAKEGKDVFTYTLLSQWW